MAQLTVRNLDDQVYARLKARAKANKRSLEAEARAILDSTGMPLFVSAMINADPPEHGRLRGSVTQLVRPHRVTI